MARNCTNSCRGAPIASGAAWRKYCFPRHPEPEDYGVDTGLILTIGGRPETALSDPKARRGGYCLLWVFSRQQKHRSALPRRPHPYILRYPDSLTPYKGCMSLSAWRALGFGAGRSIGGGASADPLFLSINGARLCFGISSRSQRSSALSFLCERHKPCSRKPACRTGAASPSGKRTSKRQLS